MRKHWRSWSMSFQSPTWTFEGEQSNCRFRRLRMLRRRISRRSGSRSALWASSSSRVKPFSIISIYLTSFQNGVSLGTDHAPNERSLRLLRSHKGLHEGRLLSVASFGGPLPYAQLGG